MYKTDKDTSNISQQSNIKYLKICFAYYPKQWLACGNFHRSIWLEQRWGNFLTSVVQPETNLITTNVLPVHSDITAIHWNYFIKTYFRPVPVVVKVHRRNLYSDTTHNHISVSFVYLVLTPILAKLVLWIERSILLSFLLGSSGLLYFYSWYCGIMCYTISLGRKTLSYCVHVLIQEKRKVMLDVWKKPRMIRVLFV